MDTPVIYFKGYPRLFTPPYQEKPPQFIIIGSDDNRDVQGMMEMWNVVENLAAYGVRVVYTLWCTPMIDRPGMGTSLERIRLIWQRLYDTGSEICNHTLNHNLNGVNWHARETQADQAREIEGNRQWLRDNIHGLYHIYSMKSGGGGFGGMQDPRFAQQLLRSQHYEHAFIRTQHPDIQYWPYKLGDQWVIDQGVIDGSAPPMHAKIDSRIYSNYPGTFDYSVKDGVAMMTANFDYHYRLPDRPIFAVNAYHDWGFKKDGKVSHRNEGTILREFLKEVMVKQKGKYPNTHIITFHQLIKYMQKNDLKAILAEGSGQDRAETRRGYNTY